MAGVSGLERIKDTEMMHHPHQPRQSDAPGDKFTQILPFPSPTYGAVNTIFLTPLDMVVEEVYVEVVTAALGGVANPVWAPAQTWVGNNGIQLKYDRTPVYTQSQFETTYYDYLNFDKPNLERRLVAYGDVSNGNSLAGNAVRTHYVPLSAISDKLLKHIGSLSAYAASKWSIDFDLPTMAQLVRGTNTTAATGGAIQSMSLVLVGHREDSRNAQAYSMALAGDGIKVVFSQANHGRTAAAAASADQTIGFTNLAGECTGIIVGQRLQAGWIGATPDVLNRLQWVNYDGIADTINIGTQANPSRIFGQAVKQRMARLLMPTDSYDGSNTFVTDQLAVNTASGLAASYIAPVQKGIIAISLEEKATTGMRYGMFSGALRLNNDFQMTLSNGTTTRTADYIDVDVLIRRVAVFRHTGFLMVNEE